MRRWDPPAGPTVRYLHRNEWFGYGVLTGAAVVASLPLFPYQWHVFLHIAGAVVFLGNIIVTGVWMLLAERDEEHRGHPLLGQGGDPRRLPVHPARRAAARD